MDQSKDAARKNPRPLGRRVFFATFKWCRISVLLLVFVVIILGLFLNHVGLPDWLEARLQKRLEEQGWEVSFSRLRLRWYHGIVAEDLHLRRTNTMAGPHLFLRNAEFRPNWSALRRLRLESEGVALKDGRLIWELAGTNQPRRSLVLNHLGGELLFKPGDTWELKYLESTCLGTQVRLRGELDHASLIREWKLPKPSVKPAAPASDVWYRLLTELQKVRVTGQPVAQVIATGDARDWRAFDITIRVTAPALHSPWGSGTNVTVLARTLPPSGTNDPIRLALQINAEESRTPWADAARLDLGMQIEPSLSHFLPTNAVLTANLTGARADWGRASRLVVEATCHPGVENQEVRDTKVHVVADRFESRWGNASHLDARVSANHGATNYLPARLQTSFTADRLHTRWLTSQWAQVDARMSLPASGQFTLFESNRLWLDRITNLPFHVTALLSNALTSGYVVDRVRLDADWAMPTARVVADVTAGEAAISGSVLADAGTREIAFTNAASLRPASFARFLSTNAQRWLADFDSLRTPSIQNAGRFTLPTWAHWPTNWQGDVLPSLEMRGRLEAPSPSYRGVEFARADIPFTLTNQVWELPDLQMLRAEGALRLSARADEKTGDFRVDASSSINPTAVRPALPRAEKVFSLFEVTNLPPRIEAQVSGNWNDWSRFNGVANVLLTNLSFRGVPIQGCTATITYTNHWLAILNPVLIREGERGSAEGIGINLAEPRLHLTNGLGRLNPLAVGQAIGPITRRTIEPYQFEAPPDARAEGSVPLGRMDGSENMRFEVDGGRFHWNVLHFDRLKGTILWQGDTLTLTNVSGLWRGGSVMGWARFDFAAPRGGSMAFEANLAGNSLKRILTDFQRGKTNRLEGTISGRIRVTHADVNDLKTWNGDGQIQMEDGLIWDIPLFGLFSPLLNAVVPGLGSSRAKEGRATFTMTNGVVYSQDLELVANATRLRYRGQVDFDGNVDALMEAELMRELPAIGVIISKVLWPVTKLFVYRVTGTLDDPKPEPVYVIPKILTLPFMPFKALKEILTPTEKKPADGPPQQF